MPAALDEVDVADGVLEDAVFDAGAEVIVVEAVVEVVVVVAAAAPTVSVPQMF